eukprot:scaffold74391_cov80-Phaeocystis_antarctica.AAC.1
MRACCFSPQCISSERSTGACDVTKAVSLTDLATDANEILLTSVLPCVTTGSPRAPFQQSISSERHPCSSCRRYMASLA